MGTESVEAQTSPNKLEINAAASTKTQALRSVLKYSNEQRDQLYTAFQAYENRKAILNKGTTPSKASIAKLEKELDDKVKGILSEEQYDRYKTFTEEN